ncbi:MAG: hypothetical protein JW797_11500 [Bradymonadales bacterium]|nr:hypothetical protein [Bradymonadales bacterium]
MLRQLILWWLGMSLLVGGAVGASAQQVRGSHRVIQLGEEVVQGRIEKPEAFYILRPTNLNYEGVAMQETFIPELLETVTEPPF